MSLADFILLISGAALQWIAFTERNFAAAVLGIIFMLAGANLLSSC